MKVLIINTVRFRLNGMTSVIMNYYRNMDKTNMEIDFVVPNEITPEYRKELESNQAKVYCIPRKSNPIKYQKRLYEIMKENQYDVVHIHGNSATMMIELIPAKCAEIPVRIVHSHNTTCSHMVVHKLLSPLFHKFYTHGFACGQDAGKWLFQDREFVELKNGIDLEKFAYNSSIREEYRNKIHADGRVVIGHIGNFIEQKNHTFLIDSYAKLVKQNKNYLLLLISDGVLLDEMKEKVHTLGIDENVLFLGKTTEAQNYLQAVDMFVLPSLHEGLPVVLVEAQAAGLPCLVADTVAREADLTNTLKYIPIQEPSVWASEMEKQAQALAGLDREKICIQWHKRIKDAGYDIKENANYMRALYSEALK